MVEYFRGFSEGRCFRVILWKVKYSFLPEAGFSEDNKF